MNSFPGLIALAIFVALVSLMQLIAPQWGQIVECKRGHSLIYCVGEVLDK